MSSKPYPLESLLGRALSPFEEFLRRTSAGSIVLLAATFVALLLASTPGSDALRHFWEMPLAISFAGRGLELSLHHWVNDGLMAIFFFLVGLELKREILVGELSSPKAAILPVVAAIGGMLVPAAIYALFNAGTKGAPGWGIPMATDIAFAVGVLVMLAWRVPRTLIIFLTALAIADDLGAVLVIAFFYTHELDRGALGISAALFAVLVLLNRGGVRHSLPYVLVGVGLWLAVLASGIHATVAGILLAATIPARPGCPPDVFLKRLRSLEATFRREREDESTPGDPLRNEEMADAAAQMELSAAAAQSPLQRIEHRLVAWVTFVVVPVFALANAGIDLDGIRWTEAITQRVTLGTAFGLVLGKFLGIACFSAAVVKIGWARLPEGVRWSQLLGVAWLAGIGFTMSLFIARLAFDDAQAVEQAKLGILLASAASACIGTAWLLVASRGRAPERL